MLVPLTAGAAEFRIIGYVRPRANFDAIGAGKLTHINYAFAQVSPGGEVVFANPETASRLVELMKLKQRNPRLRVLLSVGGWGADNFSDAALTRASRAKFARSCLQVIRKYGLDGVDLDWEYPGQPGPGIKFRPEDKQNFTLLLEAVRKAIGRRRLLTIATAGGRYFAHTEMERAHRHVDWVNMMTYDFFTGGSKTTGHHTALLRDPKSPYTVSSTDSMLTQHLRAGIPRAKIVVGVAFYGRSWTGVVPENNGLFQTYEKYLLDLPYARLVREYVDRNGFVRHWDENARAPYLWNPESRTFVSYDDPQSLRAKAEFIKRERLAGVMYWEHSHDPDEALLDVLVRDLR